MFQCLLLAQVHLLFPLFDLLFFFFFYFLRQVRRECKLCTRNTLQVCVIVLKSFNRKCNTGAIIVLSLNQTCLVSLPRGRGTLVPWCARCPAVKMLGVVKDWGGRKGEVRGVTREGREMLRCRARGGGCEEGKLRGRSSRIVGDTAVPRGGCLMVGSTPPRPSGTPESSCPEEGKTINM